MSFLAPLYLLGALAVGLPVLFHLIRRTPRGRQVFSTLMFLEASPPRVTRRSRIEHWLLLCLRALAICLLAAAFARPFFREPLAAQAPAADGRWVSILLDTSASMRREGLWDEAIGEVRALLRAANPGDRVALATFDARPKTRWDWEAWSSLDAAQRAAGFFAQLQGVKPTWHDTNLGGALVAAADDLDDAAAREAVRHACEIVVISDLQSGSRIEALQEYAWPEGVSVRLVRIGREASPTNAGLHPVAETADGGGGVRVRVTNAADSERESFRLRWKASAGGEDAATAVPASEGRDAVRPGAGRDAAIDAYVPPGQSRVVRVPAPPAGGAGGQLVLSGDDHTFDNSCFVATRVRRNFVIVSLTSDDPADPAGLRYYLEPLFPETADRTVTIKDGDFESAALPESREGVQLVVVGESPRGDQIESLRRYLEAGGCVLIVVRTPEEAGAIYSLAGALPVDAREADLRDYAMLTDIDFAHPVFSPLADPRYSDFTKLQFWRHRTIDVANLPECRVLARFDDGDIAIGEVRLGRGRLMFFASSWTKADSQLTVWSKFVPLMNALLEYGSGHVPRPSQHVVGESISVESPARGGGESLLVRGPEGSEQSPAADAGSFFADRPGLYVARGGEGDAATTFAVNVAAAETRTDPLPIEALEALGVVLEQSPTAAGRRAAADLERQIRNGELEQRQKLWRWLILAAIGVLVLETVLARLLARRAERAV